MKGLDFGRLALSMGVGVAMLAGCGGSQPPVSATGAMPQSRAIANRAKRGGSWMLPDAKGADLLYVAGGYKIVVFSYPKGRHVGNIDGLNVTSGICSDSQGNIFIPVGISPSQSTIYEYAHGGTTPIATLDDPGGATACSYDKTTGNLAVANNGPSVAVFANAQGTPTIYQTSSVPALYCAYDNVGNLFVDDGFASQALGELPVGGDAFTEVSLSTSFYPMSLQWDSGHLAIASYTFSSQGPQPFYNVKIYGSEGIVGQPIYLATRTGRHPDVPTQFWVQGKTMIGPAPHKGGLPLIDFWEYPAGGNPTKTINLRRSTYTGFTVSITPSH
jgi:hypothetical protein